MLSDFEKASRVMAEAILPAGPVHPLKGVVVPKGWGHESWIVNCPLFCSKMLHFNPGKKCSWHYHKVKNEVFQVLEGKVWIHYSWDDDLSKSQYNALTTGDVFNVPRGLRHQIECYKGIEGARILEVSTEHFDWDSIRLEKGD